MSIERIKQLEEEIRHHNDLYWNKNSFEISDQEYDLLVRELRELDPDNSILSEIKEEISGEPVKHDVPMLSMDKYYTIEEIIKWAKKTGVNVFVISPKMDGSACSLVYDKDGYLIQASTRGDGIVGEDVTKAVKEYVDIPHKIEHDYDHSIEVRGEVYMTLSEFERLNDPESNPRNLAAGTIKRKLDGEREYSHRNLKFAAYNVLGTDIESMEEKFLHCRAWEIKTVECLVSDLEHLEEQMEKIKKGRDDWDYEADGIIISVDDVSVQEEMGSTSHHPRYAIALKFQGESATTTVEDLELSLSRKGILTPVAVLAPVFLSGATITKASMSHFGFVINKGLGKGDTVMVTRRGGVIPHLDYVVKHEGHPFEVPKEFDGHETYFDGDILMIKDAENNRDVLVCKFRHFVKSLEIDEVGDKFLKKIVGDLVNSPEELYDLTVDDLSGLDRMGKRSAEKIVNNIQSKREVPLDKFLISLSIDELGKHVSRILADKYEDLNAIRSISREELESINTFGPIIAEKVYQGLIDSSDLIDRLLNKITIKVEEKKVSNEGKFEGMSFVFTGTLNRMVRNDAQKKVEEMGGEAPSSVTKNLTYLVCGEDSEGKGKHKKVTKINDAGGNIKIISEDDFISMIER